MVCVSDLDLLTMKREGLSYRHDAPILNDRFTHASQTALHSRFADMDEEEDEGMRNDGMGGGGDFSLDKIHGGDAFENDHQTGVFKYPHLQLRNVSYDVKYRTGWERVLEGIHIEAKGGEIVAIMATNRKCCLV